MPFAHLKQVSDPQNITLSTRLELEWRGQTGAINEAPIILEHEGDRFTHSTHLYVIWSLWQPLTQRERSEIIMNVYEKVRGVKSALNVTLALGLTPEEATRMNIYYELEDSVEST